MNDTMMFTFDPWKLFGLKSTSTIDEARRAYYRLAIIMHPDKGGNAEDMKALYDAYTWVYKQLEGASFPINIDDPSKTPIIDSVMGMDRKSLEACYDRLRQDDDSRTKIVALDWVKYLVERDLMMDMPLKTLEEYVQEGIDVVLKAEENEDNSFYNPSHPEGYGTFMNESKETLDYTPLLDKKKNNEQEVEIEINDHQFSKEMAIYTEPLCPSEMYANKNLISAPKKMEDFSDNVNGLNMTDYALAHTYHVISDTKKYIQEILEKNEFETIPSYKYE